MDHLKTSAADDKQRLTAEAAVSETTKSIVRPC
jgi:hypothetical protein